MLASHHTQTMHQISDPVTPEFLPAFGWPVALLVEPVGDLLPGQPLRGQFTDALAQLRVVAELLQLVHGSDHDVFRGKAACPADLYPHPLARAFHVDRDPLDHLSEYLLAVLVGGRLRPPQGRDVLRKAPDRLPLALGEQLRPLATEAVVVFLQSLLGGELLLPVFSQLASHQPVFGFEQTVVASGPLGLVGDARQSLLPQSVELLTLLFHVLCRFERELQGRRLQRFEHLLADELVQRRTRHVLALLAAVVGLEPVAEVEVAAPLAVTDGHAVAAPAADKEALQQRGAGPRSAHGVRAGPVFGQSLHVLFIAFPGDVRWQAVFDERVPLLRGRGPGHDAGTRTTGLFLARIHSTPAVGVSARIDRVLEHALQRRPGRPAPLQFSPAFSFVDADTQLHAVLDEVAEQSV